MLGKGNELIIDFLNVFVDLGTTIPAALGNGYGKLLTGEHPDFRTKVLTKDWNFEDKPRMGVEPYSQERSIELINHTFSFTLDRIFGPNIMSNKVVDFLIKLGIKTPLKKGVDEGTKALKKGK